MRQLGATPQSWYGSIVKMIDNSANLDLLVRARTIISPAEGIKGAGSIGVSAGKIASVVEGKSTPPPSVERVVEVRDGILLPGLIDLHAHPALSGSRFGIDPDIYLLPAGSTTVLSQGDAGARNLDDYIRTTIEPCTTRLKLAVNFCANGESNPGGRFFTLEEAAVDECVEAVRRGGEHVWGISLNIAFIQNGDIDPIDVMQRGINAAERASVPIMFGATKDSRTPLAEQLKLLRPGDVMTYCFHSGDGSIAENGHLLDSVWEARERGVLFDVGDGTAAFGFDVAETAIAQGFLPDTISSDFYSAHVDHRIELDLLLTASKLIAAGMTEEQVWPRVTSAPARILGIEDEIGCMRPGAAADLTVLERSTRPAELRDGHGQVRMGFRWSATMTAKAGNLYRSGSHWSNKQEL